MDLNLVELLNQVRREMAEEMRQFDDQSDQCAGSLLVHHKCIDKFITNRLALMLERVASKLTTNAQVRIALLYFVLEVC